jgi:hypothetical protein
MRLRADRGGGDLSPCRFARNFTPTESAQHPSAAIAVVNGIRVGAYGPDLEHGIAPSHRRLQDQVGQQAVHRRGHHAARPDRRVADDPIRRHIGGASGMAGDHARLLTSGLVRKSPQQGEQGAADQT